MHLIQHESVTIGGMSKMNFYINNLTQQLAGKCGLSRTRELALGRMGFKPVEGDTKIKLIQVPIKEIKFVRHGWSVPHRGETAYIGEPGGSWDKKRKKFSYLSRYRTIHDRFEKGLDWQETEIFKNFEAGNSKYKDEDKLLWRLKKLDKLYDSIDDQGYKSQLELYERSGENKHNFQLRLGELYVPDEPKVGIGRNGEIIRISGAKNRLSCSKILGINETVPCILQFRHEEYTGNEYTIEELDFNHPLIEKVS